MSGDDLREVLAEANEEMLFADGFDEALIGTAYRAAGTPVALYNIDLCIEILIERDGMDEEEALEFFDYNVIGSYVGDNTPIFASLLAGRYY